VIALGGQDTTHHQGDIEGVADTPSFGEAVKEEQTGPEEHDEADTAEDNGGCPEWRLVGLGRRLYEISP
jgi:hypothetical protein